MKKKHFDEIASHISNSKQRYASKPVYVFGMHKGGSTMLHDFFHVYTGYLGVKSLSVSDILFSKGITDAEYTGDEGYLDLFFKKCVFLGFRYVPNFMLKNKALFVNSKALILVRDPRDCVVSAYFSFLRSHVISAEKGSGVERQISEERRRYSNAGIDEYCINEFHRFLDEICAYFHFLHENSIIFRYEDIIFDKSNFFKNAIDFLELDFDERSFRAALSHVDVVPTEENVNNHIRSVSPGDHKRKLSSRTIEVLNEKGRDILGFLGYE